MASFLEKPWLAAAAPVKAHDLPTAFCAFVTRCGTTMCQG